MSEHPTEDRRKTILDAAFVTFVTYGFKRTTMSDIANAAGLSRPALYLVFPNKAEIYRAQFHVMLDEAGREALHAISSSDDLAENLRATLLAVVVKPYRQITDTPHGRELFDMKNEIGPDLAEAWFSMLETVVASAVGKAQAKGLANPALAGTDAIGFARLFVSAVEGIKARMTSMDQAEVDMDKMVSLMVRAITVRAA